jgi:hypothetical protein
MIYIRRKDNPLVIRSWGSAQAGGLGTYNTEIYEEVVADELPEGWQIEAPPLPLASQLQLLYKSLPLAARVASALVFKTCQLMLQLDDLEGARDYLIDSDLELSLKEAALALFV